VHLPYGIAAPIQECLEGLWMAHVFFYADESGKYPGSSCISFCGYVGNVDAWQRLANDWNGLRLKLDVPPIHMAAMMHPDDDEEWAATKEVHRANWEKFRDDTLDAFASLIQAASVACIGAVVDCDAFRDLPLVNLKNRVSDPHYIVFEWAILRAIDRVTWADPTGALGIIVDDDEAKAMHCYALLNQLKREPALSRVKERVSGICFADDKKYIGVQAADMIAFESRNLMRRKAPPSPLFAKLTRQGTDQPHLFNAYALKKLDEECSNEPEP
jgi:Protein of unknown function (DUF3800)